LNFIYCQLAINKIQAGKEIEQQPGSKGRTQE